MNNAKNYIITVLVSVLTTAGGAWAIWVISEQRDHAQQIHSLDQRQTRTETLVEGQQLIQREMRDDVKNLLQKVEQLMAVRSQAGGGGSR